VARTAEFIIAADADKLKRALNRATREVDKFASDSEGSFDKIGEAAKAAFGGIAGAAALAGGAAAGVFAASVGEALNREASRDIMAARFLLTPEEAERAGRIASEVYAGAWGESYDEVLSVVSEVQEQLGDIGEVGDGAVQSITENAMTLADVFEADVMDVLQAVRQMIANDLVDDSEEAFDAIAAGFVNGADRGDDFLDVLREYANDFKELGLDGAQIGVMLGAGLDAGAENADRLADNLREMFTRVTEDTAKVSDALDSIGIDGEKMVQRLASGGDDAIVAFGEVTEVLEGIDDPIARGQAAVEIFGSIVGDVGPEVVLAMGGVVGSMEEVEGTMGRVTDTAYDNWKVRLTGIFRDVRESFISEFEPVFIGALDRIEAAFKSGGIGAAAGQAWEEIVNLWNQIVVPWWTNSGLPFLQQTVVPAMQTLGEKAGEAFASGVVGSIRSAFSNIPIVGNSSIAGELADLENSFGGGGSSSRPPARNRPSGGSTGGGSSYTPPRPVGGIGSSIAFHDGGIVPGPPGLEVPAVLMAGETVLPTHKQSAASGSQFNVTVNTTGQQMADDVVAKLRMLELTYG